MSQSSSQSLKIGRDMSLGESRSWCVLAYVVAAAVGAAVWIFAPIASHFWRMAAADVAATLVIFGFSVGLNNSSMYDAYWSVAPILIAAGWIAHPAFQLGDPLRQLVMVVLISAWGVRLTLNWLRHWRGMGHEDWRYVDFRGTTGKAYWLLSLGGLHMFPTAIVLLNLSSVYIAASGRVPFGALDVLAALLTAGAIAIEALSDRQLHAFIERNKDPQAFLAEGLWAVSRHPNYFGEVCFWWGLCLFALAAAPDEFWTLAGPICMTSMFFFVSIPLIDKRMLKKRPHYAEHMRLVSRLIPWIPGAPPPLGSQEQPD